MRKFLRIALVLVVILVLTIGGSLLFINVRGIPTYDTEKKELEIEYTPERIRKGTKLASMLCKNCHLSQETGKFTGKFMSDAPPEFGKIYSKNITHDPVYGIGNWTDGELIYFLRTGLRSDGQYVPPYMPKLAHMSDEDLYSIIAFMRSGHNWVEADKREPEETQPSLLTKILCNFVFKPVPYPSAAIPEPDTTDMVALGKYIATSQIECFNCHSADFKTNNIMNPEKSVGFYGGGNIIYNLEGEPVLSANITMDKETGIGNWTEEEFVRAVRFGQKTNGTLKYPMNPFPELTEREVKSIYAYLQTVPPITNKVAQ